MDPQDLDDEQDQKAQPDWEEKPVKLYTQEEMNISGLMGFAIGAVLSYAILKRRGGMEKIPMLHNSVARLLCKDPENGIIFTTEYGNVFMSAVKD